MRKVSCSFARVSHRSITERFCQHPMHKHSLLWNNTLRIKHLLRRALRTLAVRMHATASCWAGTRPCALHGGNISDTLAPATGHPRSGPGIVSSAVMKDGQSCVVPLAPQATRAATSELVMHTHASKVHADTSAHGDVQVAPFCVPQACHSFRS